MVAYGASLLAVCLPLVMMELAVGQLTGRAPVQALFNICPLFKGVGVAQLAYCAALVSLMGIQLSYVLLHLFYLAWNLLGELPWLHCGDLRNAGFTDCIPANASRPYLSSRNFTHSSAAYFIDALQEPSGNIEEPGMLVWQPIAALGVAWILVFFAIFAGVRWLGKVASLRSVSSPFITGQWMPGVLRDVPAAGVLAAGTVGEGGDGVQPAHHDHHHSGARLGPPPRYGREPIFLMNITRT